MALVSIQPERLNVESMELMPNRLFLVGNKDFEGTKKIKLTELNNHTFIYRERVQVRVKVWNPICGCEKLKLPEKWS